MNGWSLHGVHLGPVAISPAVLTTWLIMAALTGLCWVLTRRLRDDPGRLQTLLEGVVSAMDAAVEAVLPGRSRMVLPFVATLWVFIVTANLIGLVPGLDAPTSELSVTAGLALLVFGSTHFFGLRAEGLRNYLRHYLEPNPIMLPFHIMSEITRTIALAVRLFGNMMSLEMAAVMVLLLAGLLIPVPVLMLHIVEALVQAYIFGMLALIYIAGGIAVHQRVHHNEE